jgi:hypothetical protein
VVTRKEASSAVCPLLAIKFDAIHPHLELGQTTLITWNKQQNTNNNIGRGVQLRSHSDGHRGELRGVCLR